MKESLKDKKSSRAYGLLIFATFFMYIVLTGAKNLYVAEKTTLQSLGTFGSFTDLALTMEYYFYAYAVMQVLLLFIMKRLNIQWFLTVTLSISAVITILTAFTDTIISHWVLYTVNGAMQAGIWGCSLKTLGKYLPQKYLATANRLMTSGPACAGVVAYATAALFGNNWRLPFILLGILVLCSVLLFSFSVSNVKRYPRPIETHHIVHADGTEEDVTDEDKNDFIHLKNKKRRILFYVFSALLGAMSTGLFFTLNNVLDIFLKQIGGFDNTTAKWITILAPVIMVVGPSLCVSACDKHTNFITVGLGFFVLSLIVAVLLTLFFETSVALSVFMVLVFLLLTNGGRSITLSIASLKMRSKIDTGVYSTLVNACASVTTGMLPRVITSIVDNPALSVTQNWSNAFTVVTVFNGVIVAVLAFLIVWIKLLNKKDAKNESPVVSDSVQTNEA